MNHSTTYTQFPVKSPPTPGLRCARIRARLCVAGLLLMPLFSCTQAGGDLNVIFDPTTIVGLAASGATLDPAILVYSTASSHDGQFGGAPAAARSGADAFWVAGPGGTWFPPLGRVMFGA